MMRKVNASSAGVKMSYSSLDNAFTITSSKYGIDSSVDIKDGSSGLLSTLGFEDGTVKNGSNLVMEINGKVVESDGNSVEVDGTTFTFAGSSDQIGEEFTVSIGRDTSAIADVIKDFVKEYNQLIEDVYKYLDEKPEKDYYFLADQDKEDLDLTDKQEEKWEEKAKKGLLYHDSTVSNAMSKLRTALMGSVEGLDGNTFSLSSLGIKTATDYSKHGTLVLDEKALTDAIETHTDDIQKLFTDSENGIMKKFSDALNSAVGTTGETKGTLVRKAGLKTGSSSTDNELYNLIKRTKTNIASLTKRYENEQDRLWKRYSAMESMLGTLNSQQSSFNSYFSGM
jgi:flagellar hook-associated protein 2